jgi:hypothetical protein
MTVQFRRPIAAQPGIIIGTVDNTRDFECYQGSFTRSNAKTRCLSAFTHCYNAL